MFLELIFCLLNLSDEGPRILKSVSSKKRVMIVVLITSVGVVLIIGLTLAVYAYKKKISTKPGNATNLLYNIATAKEQACLHKMHPSTWCNSIYQTLQGI